MVSLPPVSEVKTDIYDGAKYFKAPAEVSSAAILRCMPAARAVVSAAEAGTPLRVMVTVTVTVLSLLPAPVGAT